MQRYGPPARQSSFTNPSDPWGSSSLLDPLLLLLLWSSDEAVDESLLWLRTGVAAHSSVEAPERIELDDMVVADMSG